jgi:hypothetical protein
LEQVREGRKRGGRIGEEDGKRKGRGVRREEGRDGGRERRREGRRGEGRRGEERREDNINRWWGRGTMERGKEWNERDIGKS